MCSTFNVQQFQPPGTSTCLVYHLHPILTRSLAIEVALINLGIFKEHVECGSHPSVKAYSTFKEVWEPYPNAPNLATSPVGFEALFKGFGDSPYVGLQYDPSHLVRQFMGPNPDGARLCR